VASTNSHILPSPDPYHLYCTWKKSSDRTCDNGGAGEWSLQEEASCDDGGGDVNVDAPSCQQWMNHSNQSHEGTGAVGRKTWKHPVDAVAARVNIQSVD
jgi:hypothetical protein